MEFNLDNSTGHIINSYEPGKIQVDKIFYQQNIIITPHKIITENIPNHFKNVTENNLNDILILQPNIVIFGTGQTAQFLPDQLTAILLTKEIGVEFMTTNAACRTYNVLAAEHRNVLAVLFL